MNGLWGSKSRTEATDVISAMTLEVWGDISMVT